MIWEGIVSYVREIRNSYRILIGNSEGKKPLRRLDNIKMDLRKTELDGVGMWLRIGINGELL